MRKHGPYILLCMVLLAVSVFLGYKINSVGTLEPSGTWCDVNGGYYIVFKNGMFVESTFNVERPYEIVEGGIYLYDAAGEPYFTALMPNIEQTAVVCLNGESHVMRRATSREAANPLLYRWDSDNTLTGKCVEAYSLKQSLGEDYTLRLYDDNVFTSSLGSESTSGRYTRDSKGTIILLTEGGAKVDQLKQWAEGAVFGVMGTGIQAAAKKASAVEDLGFLFTGACRDEDTGTTYKFDHTGTCYRVQRDGSTTEFIYFADTTGLITMTDSAGRGIMDYLWYDAESGYVYRYVLGNDEWYAYLSGGNSGSVFDVDPDIANTEVPEPEVIPLVPDLSSDVDQQVDITG